MLLCATWMGLYFGAESPEAGRGPCLGEVSRAVGEGHLACTAQLQEGSGVETPLWSSLQRTGPGISHGEEDIRKLT